jgi:hypothetical protein
LSERDLSNADGDRNDTIAAAIGAMVEITVPIIAWSCANSGVMSAV